VIKSITPVISIILLILITIIASASAYFFINSNILDLQNQGSADNFPGNDNSRLNLVSITGSKAIVRNDGSSPVTEIVMFVNNELLNYSLSQGIMPGEYKEITFNPRQSGEELEIKIIYNKGKTVTSTSPASKNSEDSGFTENPLPLNEEAGETCDIEFSDSNPPVIEVIYFSSFCDNCASSSRGYLRVRVNVTDEIPLREVIYENAGTKNYSITPISLSGLYELNISGSYISSGTHKAYAIDWSGNTQVIDLGSTPVHLFLSCSVSPPAYCLPPGVTVIPDTYSLSDESICLGETVNFNATYSSSQIEYVKAVLDYPNSSEPLSTEYVFLEKLDVDGYIYGATYYPKLNGTYNVTLKTQSISNKIVDVHFGELTVND
jgi:hypothetical protein